ncbi:hypothetical protein WA026_006668 [Henosepilachna vigintioctopunctata]|uniref:Uncharacterized protein n=1 Tax=Henosepilachna vigintioctopunctata TaxID=420089 RepID=A0AAW1UGE6_9CUCU
MFLGTFSNTKMYFYRIMRDQEFGMSNNQHSFSQSTVTKNEREQRNVAQRECLTEFFNQLPKLPSHYCRKPTNKLYLESFSPTVQPVYNEYKKFCSGRNSNPLCRKVFVNMMTEKKSFYTLLKKNDVTHVFHMKKKTSVKTPIQYTFREKIERGKKRTETRT